MEGAVSLDETSILASSTRNISRLTKGLKYILTPWHPVQRLKFLKGENLFHKKPSRKRKGDQQKRQMNTQTLSKNELVINAEEEEGRERKQTKNKWTW